MPDATAILARMKATCEAAKDIPTDARADWNGSNHYEIQSANGDSFWWLRCRDIDFEAPVDISATEDGKRLGMVLDYACAARTGWPDTIRALEACMAAGLTTEMWARVKVILEGRDA